MFFFFLVLLSICCGSFCALETVFVQMEGAHCGLKLGQVWQFGHGGGFSGGALTQCLCVQEARSLS